jgi:hypothetical protein
MAQQLGASDDVKDFEKAFQEAFQKAFKSGFEHVARSKDTTRRRTS